MVHIQGDKAATSGDLYELPVFKLAEGLARKFKDATAVTPANSPHITRGLKLPPYNREVLSGCVDPTVFVAVLSIMEHAKHGLPDGLYADFKQAQLRGLIELRKNGEINLAVYSPFTMITKAGIEGYFAHAENINDYRFHVMLSSVNDLTNIPIALMSGNIQAAHQDLFDRTKYTAGTIESGNQKVPGLMRQGLSKLDAALFTSVAMAYKVLHEAAFPDGSVVITEAAFATMEKNEMPHRYKGRADS